MQHNGERVFALKNVRIWFEKDKSARFISHLDLNRCMTRVIQRAKIPVWRTEGFNPHPFITFALPLSLGIRGKRESMDCKLIDEDMPFKEIKDRFNKYLPEGIVVIDITEPEMKPSKISYALYKMDISSEFINTRELYNQFNEMLSLDEIMVDKKSKAGIKEVDLKENICKFTLTESENSIVLELILPAGSVTNVNPSLLLDAFKKRYDTELFADITRVDIYNEEVEPFK